MTSRSMAFKMSSLLDVGWASMSWRFCPPYETPRLMAFKTSSLLDRKILLQLGEISVSLELLDDAEIEMVLDLPAADLDAGRLQLRHDVLCPFDRGGSIARHQPLEIRVGRVDHLRILRLEALGDLLLRLLLIR